MNKSINKKRVVLIVGAGASGLACALALSSKGIKTIIVDRRPERSVVEKATGVSLGTWRLLKPFGIGMPAEAIPMRHFVFYDNDELVANVPVPNVDGCPPAHLFPQAELERLMESALASFGVTVRYGLAFDSFNDAGSHVDVVLISSDGSIQKIEADCVVGADGAHSSVRQLLGIPFFGKPYQEDWSVAEVETLEWDTSAQASLHLQCDGVGLFLSQPSPGVVQGILNAKGVASVLQKKFPKSKLRYERNFNPTLKRVPTPRKGNVWVIGDAAHTQSPVGGQGLNLAVWDGVTLGSYLADGGISVEPLLISKARRTLFFTHFDYRMLSTKSSLLRIARNSYWSFASKYPFVASWFFKIISGI